MLSEFYWTMSYRSRPTSTLTTQRAPTMRLSSLFTTDLGFLRKKIKRNNSEFYFLSSIIWSFCRKDAILVYLKLQNLPTLHCTQHLRRMRVHQIFRMKQFILRLPFTSCEMVAISLYIFSLSHCFLNSCQPITKYFSSSQPTYNLYRPYIHL